MLGRARADRVLWSAMATAEAGEEAGDEAMQGGLRGAIQWSCRVVGYGKTCIHPAVLGIGLPSLEVPEVG
jgi:hypothetical protein